MTIQPLGGWNPSVEAASGTTPTSMTSPPPTPQLNGTLDGIAQQLSMSPADLRSALGQGASITDLAQKHGVSRDDLVTSVEAQIQQTRQQNGQPALDQTTLDRMVNRAFDRHRHHHGGHVHQAASQQATSATTTSTTDDTSSDGTSIDVQA